MAVRPSSTTFASFLFFFYVLLPSDSCPGGRYLSPFLHGHQADVNHFHHFFSLFFLVHRCCPMQANPAKALLTLLITEGCKRRQPHFSLFLGLLNLLAGRENFVCP